ncbi:MAG: tRNA1(Val) (adenine(37)-N6)-methyltransferase [Bacilli bacterium]|nr:tRNA1(Val) (adenine(37)-N6)-methyltransferase [Bacilli bacterium]MDD4809086.1 tRNA1(Val) (adenine(37)-N6)-methyltransferase [Bacilli bacterium]
MDVKNFLFGYEHLCIVQNKDMFNVAIDSLLLPNFITINKKIDKILDIGCGNAPIPIILSTKTSASIIGVEIQKEVYELALQSVEANNLGNQIEIIHADINEIYSNLENNSFDIITCNPPFFKYSKESNINKNDYKTIARHEVTLNLEQIFKISKKLLKNNGIIGLVHRPERLIDIIEGMRQNNIEPKKIQFIYPRKGAIANILLIEGRKNGNSGVKILDPIYLNESNGEYSEQIKKMMK